MNTKSILNFIFELAQLKRIKHEGYRLNGIENPSSVAAHNLRAAQIGYILAHMEGYDNPEEVATMLVFHDIEECRTGDMHKLANRYVTRDKERAVEEQTKPLGEMGKRIADLHSQTENRSTKAGNIAKDADYLEIALTAKEYIELGYVSARDFIDNVKKMAKTKSAQELLNEIDSVKSYDWWQGLKKLD